MIRKLHTFSGLSVIEDLRMTAVTTFVDQAHATTQNPVGPRLSRVDRPNQGAAALSLRTDEDEVPEVLTRMVALPAIGRIATRWKMYRSPRGSSVSR